MENGTGNKMENIFKKVNDSKYRRLEKMKVIANQRND